jgi:uncharacterized membrane protein
MLQILTILVLMLAAPLAAIVIEAAMAGGSLVALAGKWFVFFFGLRLLTAGLYQIVRPDFTASWSNSNIRIPERRVALRMLEVRTTSKHFNPVELWI